MYYTEYCLTECDALWAGKKTADISGESTAPTYKLK